MAQSPLLVMSNNYRKMSGSPTLGQQPLSKRDKKRQAVESRISNIAENFSREREAQCRAQLQGINRDIHFIMRANAYGNRPLDDTADEAFSDVVSQLSAGNSIDGDGRAPPMGEHAQRFVNSVNDAMEERDARITDISTRFTSKGRSIRMDYEFVFAVAEAERELLQRSMRDRLVAQIESRKKQLKKEKEQLDAADYSATVNNALIAPGSPGGQHTNRKTRNTRRNDYDDPTPGETANKRKRKGAAEADIGSPNPGASRTRLDIQGSAFWDKVNSSSSSSSGTEVRVENYFSARELTTHNKHAKENIARRWASKQGDLRADGTVASAASSTHLDGDDGDGMEWESNGLLIAPAMDRTGSSHATRSTRALQTAASENLLHQDPGSAALVGRKGMDEKDQQQLYGRAVLEAVALRSLLKETNKDLEAQPTAGLSLQEQADDWIYLSNLDGAGG